MPSISRKRLLLFSLPLFLLIAVVLSLGMGLFLTRPAEKGGTERMIVVKSGATMKRVAKDLEEKRIISNKSLFMLWAKITGHSRRIKAGEYRLSPGMPPVRILEKLTKGETITHAVTIPEGFTNAQIAEILHNKGLADENEFLAITKGTALLKRYRISGPSLEGFLYPDTYQFGRGMSPMSIVETMVKRFRQVMNPFNKRMAELGMEMEAVVTLASIVEKETGRGEERPIIASVFLNRLKRGMRLESDPTVIYGIENFNGNLTRKDLSRRTPYNTYVIRGLPPGPIANPGRESIKAVLHPAKTDYLYFVSKNNGSHKFSQTLSEHNKAVRTFQKNRRKKRNKAS